ncbi:MAG: NINE protein [Bacteroidales bacterium]|nr:NINE protein [Bacteroidales bacterium]
MKSKVTAYLLWFFLGIFGAHKFYLGKVGMGILYLFTFGLFFIGWFIDLFTLGSKVDLYNALHFGSGKNVNTNTASNINNIVLNVPESGQSTNVTEQLLKLAELKSSGVLSEEEFNAQKTKLLT